MPTTESFTSQTLHYLMKNKLAVIGGILVLLVFILSICAPLVSPYNPSTIDIKNILVGPSFSHLLGTDDLTTGAHPRPLCQLRARPALASTPFPLTVCECFR